MNPQTRVGRWFAKAILGIERPGHKFDASNPDITKSLATMEIDDKTYALVPDGLGLSGNCAAVYGIKKRDGKFWCPKARLANLLREMREVKAELAAKAAEK